jgi:hypothetical protein
MLGELVVEQLVESLHRFLQRSLRLHRLLVGRFRLEKRDLELLDLGFFGHGNVFNWVSVLE